MIAFFSFLKQYQVFIQVFLLWKGDAVNPGQLFALFITTPICASDIKQLYSLDKPCIGKMRTTAKVCKTARFVKCNLPIGEIIQEFGLILIPFQGKKLKRISF